LSDVLDRVIAEIAREPHSAAALTLYALVSTLGFERAGCLFKLVKLRDLSAEQRQLAYELIELMVAGGISGPAWEGFKDSVDSLVRKGREP
jgi:hypothetical protein